MAASKAPARRYLRRLSTAMAIYLLSLFAGEYLIERDLVSGPVTWVLALLPGLAIIGAFWAIAMLIVETEDEIPAVEIVPDLIPEIELDPPATDEIANTS